MAVKQTDKVLHFGDLVTAVGTTQLYPLGTRRDQDGKIYRYVKLNDATVAAAAGALCYSVDASITDGQWIVSGDVSDSKSGHVVGAFMGVIANGGYGWVQRSGYLSNLKKGAQAWVNGDFLFALPSTTADGKATNYKEPFPSTTNAVTNAKLAKVLQRIIGFAAAAVSSTTSTGGAVLALE